MAWIIPSKKLLEKHQDNNGLYSLSKMIMDLMVEDNSANKTAGENRLTFSNKEEFILNNREQGVYAPFAGTVKEIREAPGYSTIVLQGMLPEGAKEQVAVELTFSLLSDLRLGLQTGTLITKGQIIGLAGLQNGKSHVRISLRLNNDKDNTPVMSALVQEDEKDYAANSAKVKEEVRQLISRFINKEFGRFEEAKKSTQQQENQEALYKVQSEINFKQEEVKALEKQSDKKELMTKNRMSLKGLIESLAEARRSPIIKPRWKKPLVIIPSGTMNFQIRHQ